MTPVSGPISPSPVTSEAPATRRAIRDFAEQFYQKVYPPDLEDAERTCDFSDPSCHRD